VRRAASALIGGITVGSLFQEQKVFDVVIWGHPDIRKDLNDVQNLLIDTESGAQVRLRDVARVSSVAAPSVIHRQGVSRRIDVEAAVSGRSVDAVTREARRRIRDVGFPFEYHAEVLGEYVERSAAVRSVYSYLIAAVVAIVLLLHAALGSWRLAALVILGAPVAALGGFVAAFLGGGVLTLGSFLGFLAILGLASRNGIIQIRRFQDLEQQDAGRGSNLILRGVEERLRAVVASTITTGAIVLPFVALGNVAGLEILHPAAVVILGGFGDFGNFRAVRAAGLVSAICGRDRSHDRSVDCGGSLMDAFPTWRTCAMPLKNAAAIAVAMIAVGLQAPAPEARADSPAPPKPESQATIKRLGFGLNQIALLPNAARRLGIQTSEITEKQPGMKITPYSSIIYDRDGDAWVYAVAAPLTYVRAAVVIKRVNGNYAYLTDGPPAGTRVVTEGVPELYGAEMGVNGE